MHYARSDQVYRHADMEPACACMAAHAGSGPDRAAYKHGRTPKITFCELDAFLTKSSVKRRLISKAHFSQTKWSKVCQK